MYNYSTVFDPSQNAIGNLYLGTINKQFQGASWKIMIPDIVGFTDTQTNINYINHYEGIYIPSEEVDEPELSCAVIYQLSSDVYKLKKFLSVNLEIHKDEVLAIIPELELYGEGTTEIEALDELEIELIDLYNYLISTSDYNLGKSPKKWKKIISSLIQTKSGN